MDIYQKVSEIMQEWMPRTTDIFNTMIETAMKQKQDLLIVIFGVTGKGKSNLAHLLSLLATKKVNEIYNLNRKFNLKTQASWLGKNYIQLFKNPAAELADLLKSDSRNKEELNKLIEKNRGMVYWLDEAKDLNGLEYMTQFNRSFSGILATCRALQYIYILCIDTPTKLIPDIREMRVNLGLYSFVSGEKRKFDDGVMRNIRGSALYGRREWTKIAFSENKKVRSSLLMPDVFLRKFKPYLVEGVPIFPSGKEDEEYTYYKWGSMGRIMQDELDKLEKKSKSPEEKKRKEFLKKIGTFW